jgi:exosome complex component RRP42
MMITPKTNAERIKRYLEEGKRFDGRKPEEYREVIIETGVSKNAEGSARVRIGKTEVLVGIKMDVMEPYPDSPNKGNLMVTAELLQLSSPRFEGGRPGFDSVEIGRVVDRGIRESKFIDFEKLCIKEGEKVWNVFIDIYSINDDGNLLDAAGIGAVAALRNAKIPKYDEEKGKRLFEESSEKSLPLAETNPLTITIYKIGDNILLDPTREEEDVSEAKLSIGISDGIISSMQKGMEKSVTIQEFEEMLKMAEDTWKNLNSKLDKSD